MISAHPQESFWAAMPNASKSIQKRSISHAHDHSRAEAERRVSHKGEQQFARIAKTRVAFPANRPHVRYAMDGLGIAEPDRALLVELCLPFFRVHQGGEGRQALAAGRLRHGLHGDAAGNRCSRDPALAWWLRIVRTALGPARAAV